MSIIAMVHLSNDTADYLIAEMSDMVENCPELGHDARAEISVLIHALITNDAIRLAIEPPSVEDLAA